MINAYLTKNNGYLKKGIIITKSKYCMIRNYWKTTTEALKYDLSYLQLAVYLLPSIDELAHFTLCPFLQRNSTLKTWPSIFILAPPSHTYCDPQVHPAAVSWSNRVRLSCPQIKNFLPRKLETESAYKEVLPHTATGTGSRLFSLLVEYKARKQTVEFACTSTECISFAVSPVNPSYQSIRAIRKSAFVCPDRKFAILRSRTNLSFVALISSSSQNRNWKFKLNWGFRGFSFCFSLYTFCWSHLAFFAQGSPKPNIFLDREWFLFTSKIPPNLFKLSGNFAPLKVPITELLISIKY